MDDELQIPEHGFDNEGAVSHTKSLKDPSKYILQSCHDNDNYTNEVLKLLHEESNQTKLSKTSGMDLSSNYVICQDETQAMMNGKCMRSDNTREKISYFFTCVDIPNQLAASDANPPVSSVLGIFKGPSMFPSKGFFVFPQTDLHLPPIHLQK